MFRLSGGASPTEGAPRAVRAATPTGGGRNRRRDPRRGGRRDPRRLDGTRRRRRRRLAERQDRLPERRRGVFGRGESGGTHGRNGLRARTRGGLFRRPRGDFRRRDCGGKGGRGGLQARGDGGRLRGQRAGRTREKSWIEQGAAEIGDEHRRRRRRGSRARRSGEFRSGGGKPLQDPHDRERAQGENGGRRSGEGQILPDWTMRIRAGTHATNATISCIAYVNNLLLN